MFNQRAITNDTAKERVMMDDFLYEIAPIMLAMAAMPFLGGKNYFWFFLSFGLAIYFQFYVLKGV